MNRLQIGIDPAAHECVAVVVDDLGEVHGRSIHFAPDRPGVTRLLQRVHALAPGVPCHFFVESSAYLWYSTAGLLHEAQEPVHLLTPFYTKAQRRCSSPRAKGDAADAEALARVVFSRGEKAMHPADIPEGPRLNLRLLGRQRATLQQEATAIKLRLLAWLGLTSPGLTQLLGNGFDEFKRQYICRYPVIGKLLTTRRQSLEGFARKHAEGTVSEQEIDELYALAQRAYSPRDLDDKLVAMQFELELQRLALLEKQIQRLDKQIAKLLPQLDPQGLAQSLPGFGPLVSAIMVAEAGTDLSRFPTQRQFCSWTGMVGRASGTGGKHLDGLPLTKAGRGIVKWALYMAANAAIHKDPQLRALYDRLRAKQKHHNAALCAVAHQLARIYWAVMSRQTPFVIGPLPTVEQEV